MGKGHFGRWWGTAVCAAFGAGVVFAVHYGRQWADGTCNALGDCTGADTVINRNLMLAIGVPIAALLVLVACRVRRACLIVLVAFVCQAGVMFAVEHADGFWLPLWLDIVIGAVTWAASAFVLLRFTSARRRAMITG
jgi:hypothetical protein